MEEINKLTEKIIGCAIESHRVLGPGLLESVYIVEEAVIVELKSVGGHDPVFEAQILTYLRVTGKKVGLPINFNSSLLGSGIKRFAL